MGVQRQKLERTNESLIRSLLEYPISWEVDLSFVLERGQIRLGSPILKLHIKFDSLFEKDSLGSEGGMERGENDGWGESDGRRDDVVYRPLQRERARGECVCAVAIGFREEREERNLNPQGEWMNGWASRRLPYLRCLFHVLLLPDVAAFLVCITDCSGVADQSK